MNSENLLEISGIKKHFPIKGGVFSKVVDNVYAVDGVDLVLKEGETLGLVGESGCGKSTLGRTLLKLYEPTAGKIVFNGQDITGLNSNEMRSVRRQMQIIFQDPFSSLNPRMTVGDIIAEPYKIHGLYVKGETEKEIDEILEIVGLGEDAKRKFPHEFSGGQRQRIGIARALALKPKLIVADEPVSALDVSIQSQILNLLVDLRERYNLSYIFVAHDLAVVEHISDRVAVMYLGRIVESATVEDLYKDPKHPYTKALISAIPEVDLDVKKEKQILTGDVPSPINPPKGCHFNPRCPVAEDRCRKEVPQLRNLSADGGEHLVSCHLA